MDSMRLNPTPRGEGYDLQVENWSAKIEYLYVDLGHFDAGVAPLTTTVSFKENIVRAGLNYKFSGPIFSRY
jgi:outer membrane immunogenic protein